jgi:hypothetical protein
LESHRDRLRPHGNQARHSRERSVNPIKRGCDVVITFSCSEYSCDARARKDARTSIVLCGLASSINTAEKIRVAKVAATWLASHLIQWEDQQVPQATDCCGCLAVVVVVCSRVARWTCTRVEDLNEGWCSTPALETRWVTRSVILPSVGILYQKSSCHTICSLALICPM